MTEFTVLGDGLYFDERYNPDLPPGWYRLDTGVVVVGTYETFTDAKTAAILAAVWTATRGGKESVVRAAGALEMRDPAYGRLVLHEFVLATCLDVAKWATLKHWENTGIQGAFILSYKMNPFIR